MLSSREIQIGKLVIKGMQNKEIAFELGITEGTAKEYLNRIYKKIGVHSRTEFAIWILEQERKESHV